MLGAAVEEPSEALAVMMEVKSWVEAACDEADTTEVTTLVEPWTVVVLAICWVVDCDSTSEDTDYATDDEKDDWAADWVEVKDVCPADDTADVAAAVIVVSRRQRDKESRNAHLSSWTWRCLSRLESDVNVDVDVDVNDNINGNRENPGGR